VTSHCVPDRARRIAVVCTWQTDAGRGRIDLGSTRHAVIKLSPRDVSECAGCPFAVSRVRSWQRDHDTRRRTGQLSRLYRRVARAAAQTPYAVGRQTPRSGVRTARRRKVPSGRDCATPPGLSRRQAARLPPGALHLRQYGRLRRGAATPCREAPKNRTCSCGVSDIVRETVGSTALYPLHSRKSEKINDDASTRASGRLDSR
jgi:hypothetical protein